MRLFAERKEVHSLMGFLNFSLARAQWFEEAKVVLAAVCFVNSIQ